MSLVVNQFPLLLQHPRNTSILRVHVLHTPGFASRLNLDRTNLQPLLCGKRNRGFLDRKQACHRYPGEILDRRLYSSIDGHRDGHLCSPMRASQLPTIQGPVKTGAWQSLLIFFLSPLAAASISRLRLSTRLLPSFLFTHPLHPSARLLWGGREPRDPRSSAC